MFQLRLSTKPLVLLISILAWLGTVSASQAEPVKPLVDSERIGDLYRIAELERIEDLHRLGTDKRFSEFERQDLGDGIAHYSFVLKLGEGEFDRVGIHRVVRESAPGVPKRRLPGAFLVHGDIWDFEAAFNAGPDSIARFLAGEDIDVWGIDLRWTRVPDSVTDFSFMADWGMESQAADVGVGLLAARVGRALTGSGAGRLFLLGWSRGGSIGYAFLNQEAQWPRWRRQVRGFIPVDIYLAPDDAGLVADACRRRDLAQETFDAGGFADSVGQLAALVGTLATADPSGASPIFPGFDNRQASLVLGAATFSIFAEGLAPAPAYHFVAGDFGSDGLPEALRFTDESKWNEFLVSGSPFEPTRLLLDADQAACNLADVSFDDHLSDVDIPVLYVGAGGGFGAFGLSSTELLGSTDVSSMIVQLEGDEDRLIDFGHGDLFLSDQAESLVWRPILEWMRAR